MATASKRSDPRARFALASALVALAAVVAVVVLGEPRGTGTASSSPTPSVAPSASASAARVTTSPSASAAATASVSAPGVKPDSAHGLVTFDNIRSEADPTGLQQPPQFNRPSSAVPFTVGLAVSPDGQRVALIRTGETTTQLITFTTAKPNDVTILVDFVTSGENAGGVAWAGDGSGSVLFAAHKPSTPSPQSPTVYSALRVVDVATKQVREIARITNGSYFFPRAWRPDRNTAAAAEVAAGSANSYDLVRGPAAPERTTLGVTYGALTASRDGTRIAAVHTSAVAWWPMDQPAAAKELRADSKGRAEYAAFRPGTDELGVSVSAPSTAAGVPPTGHFEIWNVATGAQRVVSSTVGFSLWRVDGSAAIIGSLLVDPASGATSQLPGGPFKIADVVMF